MSVKVAPVKVASAGTTPGFAALMLLTAGFLVLAGRAVPVVGDSLALVLGGNGLAMLFAGFWWYGAVDGVTETGPFNPHFVRDIGMAYLVTAGGLGWYALRPAQGAPDGACAGAMQMSRDPIRCIARGDTTRQILLSGDQAPDWMKGAQ